MLNSLHEMFAPPRTQSGHPLSSSEATRRSRTRDDTSAADDIKLQKYTPPCNQYPSRPCISCKKSHTTHDTNLLTAYASPQQRITPLTQYVITQARKRQRYRNSLRCTLLLTVGNASFCRDKHLSNQQISREKAVCRSENPEIRCMRSRCSAASTISRDCQSLSRQSIPHVAVESGEARAFSLKAPGGRLVFSGIPVSSYVFWDQRSDCCW